MKNTVRFYFITIYFYLLFQYYYFLKEYLIKFPMIFIINENVFQELHFIIYI